MFFNDKCRDQMVLPRSSLNSENDLDTSNENDIDDGYIELSKDVSEKNLKKTYGNANTHLTSNDEHTNISVIPSYATSITNRPKTNESPVIIQQCKQSQDWPKWQVAIKSELESLIKRKVFIGPMELPTGKKLIGRLVAQGLSQRPGYDFFDTYSPVIDATSYRYVLALGRNLDFEIESMDVVTAYFYGDIQEDIFMKVPEGICIPSSIREPCVKVVKALYGLRQSGRAWFEKYAQSLIDQGYSYSKASPCIFFKTTKLGKVITTIYVDDSTIMGDSAAKNEAKQMLTSQFEMKDLGQLQGCIGSDIEQTNDGIFIHQTSYTDRILEKFNMNHSTPRHNPLECRGHHLYLYGAAQEGEPLLEPHVPYASALGALSYLANFTRPDISFSVNMLARQTHAPTKRHWDAIKQLFRYLNGTRNLGLYYLKGNLDIAGYADAGFVSDWSSGKLQTGYVFTIGGTAFSWKSTKQSITATSTTHAELITLFEATKEAVWMSSFISDLYSGLQVNHNVFPITIYEDNQACIRQIESGFIKSDMTKHFTPKYYFTTDMIQEGRIRVEQISSQSNLADLFTKVLPGSRHKELVEKLSHAPI
ncbi:DNA-directed DNA polymerase [Synchytrium endobioticum]|uniref:DNA-directed DNA polymerase n=1 Tax=Synchytrium endobioticum TaxID=286115 RepID=A0A507CM84_9FUNG|nr:DNA-directed DNA polymerase [Synchytrium endobioticum]